MRRGFTLVELLVYIGISAIILIALANFFGLLFFAQANDRINADVQEEGSAAMEMMTQTIRNASAITSPATGTTATSLSLAGTTSTIFNVSSGILEVTEASGAPVPLTSARLFMSGVSFSNLSATGTPGVVRIQFTLGDLKPNATSVTDYAQTFIDSASLRP
jgi:prepilin-type N-terminal cleavage/methylation domain-containing protein